MREDFFAKDNIWPNLIKVDVEGAEMTVLIGAKTLLDSSKTPKWLIEVHSEALEKEVQQFLASHHYNISSIDSSRSSLRTYPRHLLATPE